MREVRGDRRTEAVLPWYGIGSPDRAGCLTLGEVLFEAVGLHVADPTRLGEPTDSIGEAFFGAHAGVDLASLTDSGALPKLAPWIEVVEALLDLNSNEDQWPPDTGSATSWEPARQVAIMGKIPSQTSLESVKTNHCERHWGRERNSGLQHELC